VFWSYEDGPPSTSHPSRPASRKMVRSTAAVTEPADFIGAATEPRVAESENLDVPVSATTERTVEPA